MAADINEFPWMVIIVRALMGVCEGATFPSISAMMAKWAPQEERSRMSTFIYAGTIKAYSALSLLLIFIKRLSGRHDYCIPFGWCHLQFFRMGVGILHSGRCMSDLGGCLVVLCIRYTRRARLHIARRSRLHWSSLKQSFTTHSMAFNPDFFTILGHFRGQFWQQLGLSFAFNRVTNLYENHFETGYQ